MRILFVIPGDINLPTGGYRYDKQITNLWKENDLEVELISIKGAYPFPEEKETKLALQSIDNLPDADIAVVDGLFGGASPGFLKKLSKRMPTVALIHHPLCLENGITPQQASTLEASEKAGLEHVSAVITPSPATTQTIGSLFEFPAEKTFTVVPGVERSELAIGSSSETLNLLCVGSVIERKGYKTLIQALANLKSLDWHLDCIGSTDFDKDLFDRLILQIQQEGMSEQITFHGAVSEAKVHSAYKSADIFVLPSLFEGYGMVYAEAIIRGIPVIGTTAGAIPKTVPDTCGILVEPQNVDELTQALKLMISDRKLREYYRKGAIKAEADFPTWEASAQKFSQILGTII